MFFSLTTLTCIPNSNQTEKIKRKMTINSINSMDMKVDSYTQTRKKQTSRGGLQSLHSVAFQSILLPTLSMEAASKRGVPINISHTSFIGSSSPDEGGAIQIVSKNIDLTIDDCIVDDCQAKTRGGGIYHNTKSATVCFCQFRNCLCPSVPYSGQAAFGSSIETVYEKNSIYKCPGDELLDGYESFILLGGSQSVQDLNSSNIRSAMYACGLFTTESTLFSLVYSSFVNSSSKNHLLALSHIRPDDEITLVNFIDNEITSDGLFFLTGSYAVLDRCVWLNNKADVFCFSPNGGRVCLAFDSCWFDFDQIPNAQQTGLLSITACNFNVEAQQSKNGEIIFPGGDHPQAQRAVLTNLA